MFNGGYPKIIIVDYFILKDYIVGLLLEGIHRELVEKSQGMGLKPFG